MPPDDLTSEVESGRKPTHRVRRVVWVALAVFALIQFIPYGHDHANPPVTAEPAWDSATTRVLAVTACFDCHSNQTQWYWYTNVAPFSWLVQRDVQDGRATLNFSEWTRAQDGAGDVADVIRGGSMPPWYYWAVHWAAKLSPNEKTQLIAGLQRTFQASPPIGGG
jgi:mono/diheme cytochrome c family protein